ncbi:MAG: hypothetical protein RLZZ387_1742, partial [Chloroflexota bacterium]
MSTLEYREVPPEDYPEFARYTSVAYDGEDERALALLNAPGLHRARGVYRDGRLVTVGLLYAFQVQTGGAVAPCGGVGSVATPPEHRRQGGVERLLRGMADELRAEGTPFCTLGAFKESFYGRYGWATCLERRVLSGSPRLFAPFRARQQGAWERVGTEAIPELDAIYSGALRARFGPLARHPEWWKHRVLHGWDGKLQYIYLWRDDAGAARAYVLFRFRSSPAGRVLECREAVALDPMARAQIFALFASHEDQSEEVRFAGPSDAPVQMLLPDPLECKMEAGPMLRLVDVAGALAALRYPGDAHGRLAIAVADDWLPHNHGVFELEVAEGR